MNKKYVRQIEALRKRAAIRREATGRKSVEEGKVDRLAQQLDAAADSIERLAAVVFNGSMRAFQAQGPGSNPGGRSKLRCTDCGRERECWQLALTPSVGYKDGKEVLAEPAMICTDLEDCIKHCEIGPVTREAKGEGF